jgi:hypothetical protein
MNNERKEALIVLKATLIIYVFGIYNLITGNQGLTAIIMTTLATLLMALFVIGIKQLK